MRVLLVALVLSSTAFAQIPRVAVYPVQLQSSDGSVVFTGAMAFLGGHPIMLGTLTVQGDPIEVPPQYVQSQPHGLWWKWALPGGHTLSIGSYPESSMEGLLVTTGGGWGATYVPLH